jgi:hypothetical protein
MAKQTPNWMEKTALRITRVHFGFIAFYALTIIIFDTWNLLTHEAVGQRWTAAAIMLVLTTVLWYATRLSVLGKYRHLVIIWHIILADIIFASWNVYNTRGMASKAVALFFVPIVSAALLKSRSTLLAATSLSVAGYSLAAVRYFNDHYGEGYRVELYGEVFFYSALFFVVAWLLMIFFTSAKD